MIENIDLLSKRAALKALESSIGLHISRAEELNIQYQALDAEITALENENKGPET